MHHFIQCFFSKVALLSAMLVLSVAVSLPLGMPEAKADEAALSLPHALNIAGRQRMLTQRVVKFYCLLGMKIQQEDSKKKMMAAADLFEQQLMQLQSIQGVDAGLSEEYMRGIREYWTPVVALLSANPTLKRAHKLRDLADKTLKRAHTFVLELESISGSSQGKLVNIAGRQRMLSQRISGYYMEKSWGVDDDGLELESARAQRDFDEALEFLQASDSNTEEINKLLRLVHAQWHAFTAINKLNSKAYSEPALVSEASDNILKMMNAVTGMYAVL